MTEYEVSLTRDMHDMVRLLRAQAKRPETPDEIKREVSRMADDMTADLSAAGYPVPPND